MKEIIQDLYDSDNKVNYDAMEKARNYKGKINSYLLEEIEKMIDNYDEGIELPICLDCAFFLLAEFKEKKLYPFIIRLLDRTDVDTFDEFGMGLIDKISSIVVSVFDGDFYSLNKIIENTDIDSHCRGMLLLSYIYFYNNNVIQKEELIQYLRNLIQISSPEAEEVYNNILEVIISCHLFEMMEDVKQLFIKGAINERYLGTYDDFVDHIFDYSEKYSEDVCPVENAIESMKSALYFTNEEEENKFFDNICDKLENHIEESLKKCEKMNGKIGRNDLCPCGSGKKYKKCCLGKPEAFLPYQEFINESLENYPKKNENENQIDFYTYYKEEYIEIDKLLYKALKYKQIPKFVKRNLEKENEIEFGYLNEAYPLIKNIIQKKQFKTIEEYDKEVSIHYSLYQFFTQYSHYMIEKMDSNPEKYVTKLKELLDFFYEYFDLDNEEEGLFLNRKDAYYIYSGKANEGVQFFLEKLKTCKCDKRVVYHCLFDEYMELYDSNRASEKMDEIIQKEEGEIKEYLEQIKEHFLEDNEY